MAGRKEFALSPKGLGDAQALAEAFCRQRRPHRLVCSPLLRARQTAAAFAVRLNLELQTDDRLAEQDLGRFAGMTYAEAEADPLYVQERSARWNWEPDGGGESYCRIAERVQSFLAEATTWPGDILVVTHAVTLRLFHGCLEGTLPVYPESIAANGEIWQCDMPQKGLLNSIKILQFNDFQARNPHCRPRE